MGKAEPRRSERRTQNRVIAPTHSELFLALMAKHYPSWHEARAELSELPLAAEIWNKRSGVIDG